MATKLQCTGKFTDQRNFQTKIIDVNESIETMMAETHAWPFISRNLHFISG